MSTSGSVNFISTRNQIILDAFYKIGVYGRGRTVSSEDMELGVRTFNRMIKQWQTQNIHLWQREEGYLFIEKSVGEYQLGNASSDAYLCSRTDAVFTTVTPAEAAGQTAISVASSAGMATNDFVAIELTDGNIHKTTITNVNSSVLITIAAALPSAAAAGNSVYSFTSRTNKPLEILSIRRKTEIGDNSTTIPLTRLTQDEFMLLPNRQTDGYPTHYYYAPDISDGRLYLYQRPKSADIYFEVTFRRMLEDLDSEGDNMDFPVEWEEPAVYQLAYRLAPDFGKDKNMLQPEASMLLDNLLNWDHEEQGFQIQPDVSGKGSKL